MITRSAPSLSYQFKANRLCVQRFAKGTTPATLPHCTPNGNRTSHQAHDTHAIYGENWGEAAICEAHGEILRDRPRHGARRGVTPFLRAEQRDVVAAGEIAQFDQNGRHVRRAQHTERRLPHRVAVESRHGFPSLRRDDAAKAEGETAGLSPCADPSVFRRYRCRPAARQHTAAASALFSRSARRADSASDACSEPV